MENAQRQTFWQQQVSDQAQTQLSAAAFCRERSLVYRQFIYWRQQLDGSVYPAEAGAGAGFARVTHTERADTIAASADGLSVTLPSGVQISGLCAGNISLLGQLVAQL